MAMKLVPVVQVLLQSLGSSVVRTEKHGLADVMSDRLSGLSTEGLRYWDLNDPETGLRTCGYTLEPQINPKNAYNVLDSTSAVNNADYGDIGFVPTGDTDSWAIVTPDYEPYTSALRWYNSDPNAGRFHAVSQVLPRGQDFAVQLHTHGYTRQAADNAAFWQVAWGNQYAIQVQGGGKTYLCRRQTHAGATQPTWEPVREIPVAAEDFGGSEPTWLKVHHIAGRVVVDVEQGKTTQRTVYCDVQTQGNASDPWSNGQPRMVDATPRAASRLVIEGQGVPFSARVHEIQYAENGSLTRQYPAGGTGSPTSAAFGHQPDKGKPVAEVTHATPIGGTGAYTATLDRSATAVDGDVMEGHSTPFVGCLAASWDGALVAAEETWLDLSVATLAAHIDNPDPRLGGGTKATVRIRTDLLPECIIRDANGNEIGTAGADFADYVRRYHRAHIRVSWQYDDEVGGVGGAATVGVKDPADGTLYECAHAFDGYVWSLAPDLPGFGQGVTEITLRDGLCRFEKPAGLIDQRFVAGDMVLADMVRTDPRAKLYGADMAEYIAGVVLGEDLTEFRTFYPTGHYDLMQYKQLLDPPFNTGFFFPPPWGQSAADWIKQFTATDFGVFFFGAPTDGSAYCPAWVPWYGDYYTIFGGMTPIRLPDSYYNIVPVHDNDLATSTVGAAHETSLDYTRVVVWGKYPQDPGGYQDIMPALPPICGSAVVETTLPEQQEALTWRRTLLLQGTSFWCPMVARIVAWLTARMLRNVEPKRVTVKMRGEPLLWGGNRVWLELTNSTIWNNNIETVPSGSGNVYRIMRVRHDIDLVAKTFETTLALAPEPNTT